MIKNKTSFFYLQGLSIKRPLLCLLKVQGKIGQVKCTTVPWENMQLAIKCRFGFVENTLYISLCFQDLIVH